MADSAQADDQSFSFPVSPSLCYPSTRFVHAIRSAFALSLATSQKLLNKHSCHAMILSSIQKSYVLFAFPIFSTFCDIIRTSDLIPQNP